MKLDGGEAVHCLQEEPHASDILSEALATFILPPVSDKQQCRVLQAAQTSPVLLVSSLNRWIRLNVYADDDVVWNTDPFKQANRVGKTRWSMTYVACKEPFLQTQDHGWDIRKITERGFNQS